MEEEKWTLGDLPPTDKHPLVLFAGRLEIRKGLEVLLRAAPLVIAQVPNVRFVLAGGSHPTLPVARLESLIDSLGVRGNLELLGHVPRSEIYSWFNRATLCAMPSYYETFGLTALEAMSAGLPVVATKVNGLSEVVEDGISGLLVPPGDATALAEAITRLLLHPDDCRRMGLSAKARALSRYDVNDVVRDTLSEYEDVRKGGAAQ
jgi:glycosyltransferase involved in cell wall biosynthesis